MALAYYTCDCCGRDDAWRPGNGSPEPTRCGMCRVRGGLCLHNLGTRGDGRFHSSRPHPDPNPHADSPETCPPCLAAAAGRAWLRERGGPASRA